MCKIQCNHYMAENFTLKSEFEVNLQWKRQKSIKFKILPLFSKKLFNLWSNQFLHNIKVVDLEKLNNFHVGHFFI